MKLFKSLLVAPATLGLLAPMSATANEVTISDFAPAEELAVTNSRVDGLEARLNNFEAGSFSETTTASFSADMAIGAENGVANNEAVAAAYSFQIDLSTSFTGEDSLDISIDAGNAGSSNAAGDNFTALEELDLNSGGDGLAVDGIAYTFPVGEKTTVFVGDNMDGSTLYNTACVYGTPTNTMDDCGNASAGLAVGTGTAAGASFELGGGWTAAIGYEGDGATNNGLLTAEGFDAYGGQVTYTADSYGASVTYANIESADDTTFWALNGYWTPDSTGSVPSISVGYEMGDPETAEDTTQYFIGVQWDEVGPGTFGAAIGNTGAITEGAEETMMYEAFYSYPLNDGMTITPVVYVQETAGDADDVTGVLVKTSFSF